MAENRELYNEYENRLFNLVKWLSENLPPNALRDTAYFKLQESLIYVSHAVQLRDRND